MAAVAYLGVYKSQLLSIVNIFGVMGGNLPIFKYNLGWYLFALFAVVTTVLLGRLYCGRICAYGALTQLLDPIVPARFRYDVPLRIERQASKIKYGILGAVRDLFSRHARHVDLSLRRAVLDVHRPRDDGDVDRARRAALATVFVRNLYCRFLCPFGAALGLLSKLTIFGIKRWSECKSCKLCEKTCQWGAIEGPKIIMTECVRCDDCERLYMDQQKCPHWIIIRRKSDLLARQPPDTAAVTGFVADGPSSHLAQHAATTSRPVSPVAQGFSPTERDDAERLRFAPSAPSIRETATAACFREPSSTTRERLRFAFSRAFHSEG